MNGDRSCESGTRKEVLQKSMVSGLRNGGKMAVAGNAHWGSGSI